MKPVQKGVPEMNTLKYKKPFPANSNVWKSESKTGKNRKNHGFGQKWVPLLDPLFKALDP